MAVSTNFVPSSRGSSRLPDRTQQTKVRLMFVWPAVLFFYSFLIPPEIFADPGGFRLYGYRAIEFLLLPIIFVRAARGQISLGLVDLLILMLSLWVLLSYSMVHGFAIATESGGALSVDILAAYFVGRVSFRSIQDVRSFLILVMPGILFSGLILMLESISQQLIFRPALANVFSANVESGFAMRSELRLGLLRAYGPFYHPIMAGLFLLTFLPLYWLSFSNSKIRPLGILGAALGLFSMSSSAFLAATMTFGLISYDKLQKFVRELSWPLFVGAFLLLLFLLEIASKNGAIPIIYRYLTFNPTTGYYRTLIWQYAGAAAWANPLFGIGQYDWARPPWMASASIDAHFLLLSVRHGIPAALFLLAAFFLVIGRLAMKVSIAQTNRSRNLGLGVAFALTVVLALLFTVAAVHSINALVLLILAMGYNLSSFREPSERTAPADQDARISSNSRKRRRTKARR